MEIHIKDSMVFDNEIVLNKMRMNEYITTIAGVTDVTTITSSKLSDSYGTFLVTVDDTLVDNTVATLTFSTPFTNVPLVFVEFIPTDGYDTTPEIYEIVVTTDDIIFKIFNDIAEKSYRFNYSVISTD